MPENGWALLVLAFLVVGVAKAVRDVRRGMPRRPRRAHQVPRSDEIPSGYSWWNATFRKSHQQRIIEHLKEASNAPPDRE